MQVTIRHRQAPNGNYVDCRVEFNEEEKAIIRTRNLSNDYKLELVPALPSNAGAQSGSCSSVGLGILVFAFLPLGLIFLIFGISGPVIEIIIMGAVMSLIGGTCGVAWIILHEQGRIASREQSKSLADLMVNPNFTVWYSTRDAAQSFDSRLRSELASIKLSLESHVEEKKTETFEL